MFDEATKKREFGHDAHILAEIDLFKKFFDEVMVEREGFVFFVYIVYERLSEFCSNCFNIGHLVSLRNKLHPENNEDRVKLDKAKLKGDYSTWHVSIEGKDKSVKEDESNVLTHEDQHECAMKRNDKLGLTIMQGNLNGSLIFVQDDG